MDRLTGGTNTVVAQSDSLKGSGGAGGGSGKTDGIVYGHCNEGCSQGLPSMTKSSDGMQSTSIMAANERSGILSKLGSKGMSIDAKAS